MTAARTELRAALHAEDGGTARRLLHGALTHTAPDAPDPSGNSRPLTDELLAEVARVAAAGAPGSALATELLIETLDRSGIVRRFAAAALLDTAAVDDVAQDSLISIGESIGSFRGEAKVSTWVHRIVRNRVVDHLRRQRATAPLPAEDVGPGQRMSSMIATRASIDAVLADLPEHYRNAVILRDVRGLPYAEVADRLGVSLAAVKSRIARGRALAAASLRGSHEVTRG